MLQASLGFSRVGGGPVGIAGIRILCSCLGNSEGLQHEHQGRMGGGRLPGDSRMCNSRELIESGTLSQYEGESAWIQPY